MQVISNHTKSNIAYNQIISVVPTDDRADLLKNLAEDHEDHVKEASAPPNNNFPLHGGCIDMAEEVRKYERSLILHALKITGGNQRRAARLLGLRPTTLNSKIKRHKIDI